MTECILLYIHYRDAGRRRRRRRAAQSGAVRKDLDAVAAAAARPFKGLSTLSARPSHSRPARDRLLHDYLRHANKIYIAERKLGRGGVSRDSRRASNNNPSNSFA